MQGAFVLFVLNRELFVLDDGFCSISYRMDDTIADGWSMEFRAVSDGVGGRV